MFNDAGVNIHIHKMGFGQSDEEIDFSFLVAKALGRTEIDSRRLPGGRAQKFYRLQLASCGKLLA